MTAAIVNQRLRRRFARWDVNDDGVLDRSDFEKEAEVVAAEFGTSINTPQGQALKDALLVIFNFHAEASGVGRDGSITLEQFIGNAEKLIHEHGETAFDDVLRPLVKAIIGLCDKEGDGLINHAEFVSWLKAVGVHQPHAADAFTKLDVNGDGELSLDELLGAVRDFHFGRSDVELLG
jgi:hypothetical protein